jgi:hypothetical protein
VFSDFRVLSIFRQNPGSAGTCGGAARTWSGGKGPEIANMQAPAATMMQAGGSKEAWSSKNTSMLYELEVQQRHAAEHVGDRGPAKLLQGKWRHRFHLGNLLTRGKFVVVMFYSLVNAVAGVAIAGGTLVLEQHA